MAKKYLETFAGFYVLIEGDGKSWQATVSPRGTGSSPMQGKTKVFKAKSEADVTKAARKAVADLPRP